MARRKVAFEKDLRLLVKRITDFEEDEENFTFCLDYVSSGLKFHRYLEPDSHKIERSINGLVEKFQIHSQNEKAEALRSLVSKYLELPAFEDREYGKTATHYSVLSLLLCLSNSPLSVTYVESADETLSEKDESFDWASYLLEDISAYTGGFSDSSDSFDDEEDDDDEEEDIKSRVTFAEDTVVNDLAAAESSYIHQNDDIYAEANDWLRRNVVVQYWAGQGSCDLRENQKCGLLLDWEHYQSRINPVFTPSNKLSVTEHHLIRETIWLLLGVPASVVYVWNGTEYKPNEALSVTHLTQGSLSSVFTEFAHYGTIVRHLYEFVDEVSGTSAECPTASIQTYQAFSAALSLYLQKMQKQLVSMEKDVLLQEESHTLMRLVEDIRPQLTELKTLEILYVNGIAAFRHVTSASQKASGLLGVLFEMITESDVMGEYDVNKVTMLLMLWIQSSKPYLDIIDQWTAQGKLVDPKGEFIIQRNIDIRSLDENFWDAAFVLHCTHTAAAENTSPESPKSHITPSFLLPVLNRIILAGKSMELIQSLGHLSEVHQATDKRSLYQKFIEAMEAEVGQKKIATESEIENKQTSASESKTPADDVLAVFKENTTKQVQLLDTFDPLLHLNFTSLLTEHTICNDSARNQVTERLRVKMNGLKPVTFLLEKCLYPHITDRSADLLHILKQHYHLHQYFAAVKRIYLMEAGDVMFDFYRHIFEKLRLREPWQDPTFLNCTLQEALQSQYPGDVKNVYVTVEAGKDKKDKKKPLLMALDGLTIHYKVPWPVNIVLNTRCLDVYNEVFHFLLQIKRVKYALDELRFSDLEREGVLPSHDPEVVILGKVEEAMMKRRQRIHRIHIMRMKLMHFVNSLHIYFMTRTLHSTGLEFEKMLATAEDLDAVIKVHNIYMTKLYQRCLLHKRVSFLQDIITKILELSLAFAFKWEEGVDNFREEQLAKLESEFSRCSQFLSSFISNCIKRGSFPHMESLAFALIAGNETGH